MLMFGIMSPYRRVIQESHRAIVIYTANLEYLMLN